MQAYSEKTKRMKWKKTESCILHFFSWQTSELASGLLRWKNILTACVFFAKSKQQNKGFLNAIL